jgi:hypothetical protein
MRALVITGRVTTEPTLLQGQDLEVRYGGMIDTVGRGVTLTTELINAGSITSRLGHAVVVQGGLAIIVASYLRCVM